MVSRVSLDALPNELLLEILQCLTRDSAIPSRYKTLILIASISRHFRELALPYTFNEIPVSDYKRLPAMFKFFRHHLSQITYVLELLHNITSLSSRTISVEHPPSLPAGRQFTGLHNLVNFDCVGFCFKPTQLAEVFGASNPRLRSLRLGWNPAHVFPFELFPALERLFVFIYTGFGYDTQLALGSSGHRIFPSLTTLSIMDNMGWFETMICGQVIFPNLRAFHLLPNSTSRYSRLFGFICDSPALLEDWNTHSPMKPDRLPRADFPSLSRMDHPDFAIWNGLELAGFSFARSAQLENLVAPTSPHKLIKLSLETSPYKYNSDPLWLQNIGGLGEFPLFADCTKLSLVIPDATDGELEDPELDNPTDDASSEDLSPALPSVDMRLPIQDNYALDFQTYCEREFDDRASIEEFRQTFIDLGLECRDDNCAMQLWKATNEKAMAVQVRDLASACMTLEVFEWSMRARDFDSFELSLGLCAHPPLWCWDIHRNSDGGVESVSGRLTWNGLANHPSSCLDEQFKKLEIWSKRYEK
ncbi:hypothetical protein B0H13DRAFT_2108469 [Mycena leptocephala]|nr:hypothetical protein B0H13DRAFT_2108469 [Mycena leptocephala]